MSGALEGYQKPLPVPDPDSLSFWQGASQNKLLIQRCRACGHHHFPPSNVCAACGSDEIEWVEASGLGRVFSWIVVVHPVPKPVYAADVPYVVALVELDEGVRMPTNIIGCDPGQVSAGMRVKVVFRRVSEEIVLPLFQPAESDDPDDDSIGTGSRLP